MHLVLSARGRTLSSADGDGVFPVKGMSQLRCSLNGVVWNVRCYNSILGPFPSTQGKDGCLVTMVV